MNKNKNREFFFVQTEANGAPLVMVASPDSPMWSKSFTSLNEAIDAVKSRNASAKNFISGVNKIVAVYE